jgi:hypothetical protein
MRYIFCLFFKSYLENCLLSPVDFVPYGLDALKKELMNKNMNQSTKKEDSNKVFLIKEKKKEKGKERNREKIERKLQK